MENISVLVVMPLFNARPYVAKAVNSILGQTYPHFHLLVIDDGSTDGGDELVAQMQDHRILVWHQENSGPGFAMNRAIEYARINSIPFIARMDADDISLPDRLEKQINLLRVRDLSVAACSSNCYYIDDKTEALVGKSTVPIHSSLIKWEIQNGLRGLIQGSLVARTSALVEVGGYRGQFHLAEESDLFLRLVNRFNFTNSPSYLYKIRIRPESLSLHNADENIWFSLYALYCMKRRNKGKEEPSYEEFRRSPGSFTRYKYWREERSLYYWRKSIAHPSLISLMLASLIDPRRAASRMLRFLDAHLYQDKTA